MVELLNGIKKLLAVHEDWKEFLAFVDVCREKIEVIKDEVF